MKTHTDRLPDFLGNGEKKIVFYHTDTDGISAVSIFLKFYPEFETYPLEGPVLNNRLVSHLKNKKPDVMVMLDLPLDQEADKLEDLQKVMPELKMVIIDHHIAEKDMNSPNTIHINPRFDSKDYIPAGVMVYELMKEMGKDVSPYLWIAAVSVIGDHAFDDCAYILREAEKAYPETGKGDDSKLSLLAKEIMATVIKDGVNGAEKSVGYMRGIEKWEDAADNRYFRGCFDKVEGEINSKMSGFREKAVEFPDLGMIFYRIDSQLSIASTISTRLADMNPDKIIFVIKKSGNMMKVSARYQKGDISLNDILKKAVKGIGSGGGHVKAAGAVVPLRDWPEFEKRIMSIVKEARSSSA